LSTSITAFREWSREISLWKDSGRLLGRGGEVTYNQERGSIYGNISHIYSSRPQDLFSKATFLFFRPENVCSVCPLISGQAG
jgi:hypothetical protein